MQDSDLTNMKILNSLIEVIYKKTQEKPVVKIIGDRVFIKITYRGMIRELELSLHRLDIMHVFNDIRWLKLSHENNTLNKMAKKEQKNKASAYKVEIRELLWALVIVCIVNAIVIAIKF